MTPRREGPERNPRIAIDGPSGAGKSTLARALSQRLKVPYVDTGAMYRAVAWVWQQLRPRPDLGSDDGPNELVDAARSRLSFRCAPGSFAVICDGDDVTEQLRSPEVGLHASQVAALPQVRAWLAPRQRELAAAGGVVEGRDIGTVVMADADVKFFVTATESERLRRRAAQLGVTGVPESAAAVTADVRDRDHRDRTRATSPLQRALDAVPVDTSEEAVDASVRRLLAVIDKRLAQRG